jgi:tetratricopeptide (TPR) repeat protein
MRTLAAVSAIVVSIASAPAAEAQQVIRVAGTVRDDSGRAIRGAIVTAENPDQSPARLTATSNDKGQFGFIIRRGLWTFSLQAPGHESVRFNRQVAAGRQEPLDLRLARDPVQATRPLDGTRAAEIQQRIDRAEALAAGDDLEGAIAAWRDVLARVPGLTAVHLQIGALYERKSDPERALASYRQLLEFEPANGKARAAVERLTAKLR